MAASRDEEKEEEEDNAAGDVPPAAPPAVGKRIVGRPKKNATAAPAAPVDDAPPPPDASRAPLCYSITNNTRAFNRKVEADKQRRLEVEAAEKKRLVDEAEAASDFLLRPNPNGNTPTVIFKRTRVPAKLADGTVAKPQVKLTRVQKQNLQSEDRLLEQMGKKRAAPSAAGSGSKR